MNFEFYDTNVIVFLLDNLAGDEEKLRNFLSGRKILVTNRVMGEIRASNSRNSEFERLVNICEVYFVDPDKIAEEECWHHSSPGGFSRKFQPSRLDAWLVNVLEHGTRDILPSDVEIKENMFRRYGAKIQSHIDSMHDGRELRASINMKVSELGQELGIDISFVDVTYEKFASRFVFDYVWWFRFSRQNIGTVNANDLYDLLNIIVAPYVSVWVGERAISPA